MLKSFGFFIITIGVSLTTSVIFASALQNLLPIEGVLYVWIAMATAVIVTMIIFAFRLFVAWPNEWGAVVVSALSSLIITGTALTGYYFVQPILNPPDDIADVTALEERIAALETKMGEVETDLLRIGLRVEQIQTLQDAYVRNGGYLSVQDLAQAGLNQTQMQQVEALIITRGLAFPTPQASVAAQAEPECYVQPLSMYNAVNVRTSPEQRDNNILTVLMQREQARVIGHNDGVINTTRWWLIELPNETRSAYREGWVASSVVTESDLTICNDLPRYAR